MTDTISLFHAFIRVVEAGSFTRVAQEQNSSQPTVSRQVAALEEHLGARLFTRTARKLTLTDDGRGFYERAKLAIEAVSEAEDAVGRRRARPSGALRLAMPVVFGRLRVIPHLKEFLTRYPDVSIDLAMNDAQVDLVEEGIDLAIRSGEVTDNSLIARKIGVTRRVVVAAPSLSARQNLAEAPGRSRRSRLPYLYRDHDRRALAFCRSRRAHQRRGQGSGANTQFGRHPRSSAVGPRYRLSADLASDRRNRDRTSRGAAGRL